MSKETYFMIDRRSLIGNCVVFWAKDHKGYTTDLEKAHMFSKEEAISIERNRCSECAIPYEEAMKAARLRVDFQDLDRKYFKSDFNYFTEDQQESDMEKENKELKRRIREMKDLVRQFQEYDLSDYSLLENALDQAADGKEPTWSHYDN